MRSSAMMYVTLIAMCIALSTSQAGAATNQVVDGSFETLDINPNETAPMLPPWYMAGGVENSLIYDAGGLGLFNSLPYGDQVLYTYGSNWNFQAAAQDLGPMENIPYTVRLRIGTFIGEQLASYQVALNVKDAANIMKVGTNEGAIPPDPAGGDWATVQFTTDPADYNPAWIGQTLQLRFGCWTNSIGMPGPQRLEACWDDVKVFKGLPPTPGAITGSLTLQSFAVDSSPIAVKIQVIENGMVVRGLVKTFGDGTYTISDVDPGTYNVAFSAAQFVRTVVTGVVVSEGETTTIPPVTLANGDADGDSEVTTTDLSVVLKNKS